EIAAAGGKARAITTDVADPASLENMIAVVEQAYGRIDILINNAAIFSTLDTRPFEEIPLAEWEAVLKVNVTGPFLCCRAVLPAMRRTQWGRIVNMASGAVTLGRPNYLHYITSKAALVGMTRSMARELGRDGITVNAFLPGAISTEIQRKTVTPEEKQRIVAMQCIPRPEVPEDLVGTVLFLASDVRRLSISHRPGAHRRRRRDAYVTDRMVGRGRLIPIVPRSSRRWFIVTEMWVARSHWPRGRDD